MSTYATTVWIDLSPAGPVAEVAVALDGMKNPTWREESPLWVDVESERVRLTTYLTLRVELTEQISDLVASAGHARAAIAEDGDEFGACWTVLAAEAGRVTTVHRRYVLNANPRSRRQVRLALKDLAVDGVIRDPRVDDIAGEAAAAAAAALFEVDPAPMIVAENASDRAYEGIGVVGGPFPWHSALGLHWPGPEAGRLFRP